MVSHLVVVVVVVVVYCFKLTLALYFESDFELSLSCIVIYCYWVKHIKQILLFFGRWSWSSSESPWLHWRLFFIVIQSRIRKWYDV